MDAIIQLKNISKTEKAMKLKRENIAFYFAPQGLEYSNMGLEATSYNEVFREVMQKCCHLATKLIDINFRSTIHIRQKKIRLSNSRTRRWRRSSFVLFSVTLSQPKI